MIKMMGLILLNLSSVATGFNFLFNARKKCLIADELIMMCDLMIIELGFSSTNTKRIIKILSADDSLKNLDFLNTIDLENILIKTPLRSADNEKLNFVFKNLGQSDSESTISIIKSFKETMQNSSRYYKEYYNSHKKMYLSFGILGGLAISTLLV